MPIDHFDRARFEAALPRDKNGDALWRPLGVVAGEYCYLISVKEHTTPGVHIYIRSSVDAGGHAADTAKDSIRCWLAADETGKPLGSKAERWISRVNGWEHRMTETLRTLWRLGRRLGPCPRCGAQMHALRVKKQCPNIGRWFESCPLCRHFSKWLDIEPQVTKMTLKGERLHA